MFELIYIQNIDVHFHIWDPSSVFRNMRGKNALHRNRAKWSFSQDTAANLTDPLGRNKASNCSTLSVHQTSSDAIIGVVSGNQRQKPSRYLPDIWTKRGPRDIWAKAVRRRWQKKGSSVVQICISSRFPEVAMVHSNWDLSTQKRSVLNSDKEDHLYRVLAR